MDVLLQFQADLLGVTVRRAAVQETTALGGAYLAGLGAGVWTSTEELAMSWRADRDFEPRDQAGADRRHRRWSAAVERAGGWAEPGRRPGDSS
jgi:glycerol kinase